MAVATAPTSALATTASAAKVVRGLNKAVSYQRSHSPQPRGRTRHGTGPWAKGWSADRNALRRLRPPLFSEWLPRRGLRPSLPCPLLASEQVHRAERAMVSDNQPAARSGF